MNYKKMNEKEVKRANVRLEADSIVNQYVEIAQNTLNMLSFVATKLDGIPFEEIPRPPIMTPIELGKMNYKADKKIFLDMWLYNHGINDLIKALNLGMGRALYLAELSKIHGKTMLFEEYQELEMEINKKVLKKDLPTLISDTSKLLNGPMKYEEEILSINNLRKCIEHRAGIVTAIDANHASFLEVRWIGIELSVKRKAEKMIIRKVPFSAKKDDIMNARLINRSKSFETGERVRIDLSTFFELALTGYQFVKHITDNFNFGNDGINQDVHG